MFSMKPCGRADFVLPFKYENLKYKTGGSGENAPRSYLHLHCIYLATGFIQNYVKLSKLGQTFPGANWG